MILRNLEMELIDRTFSLLGKSEKNFEISKILNELGVSQPLPRANDDTDALLLEDINSFLFLGFTTAETLPLTKNNLEFMEGELILSSLAIQYNPEILDETLPFELDFNLELNEVTNKYGNYDWKRDYDNAYEWTISEFKVLLVFNDDNSKLLEICYGLPQWFHIE